MSKTNILNEYKMEPLRSPEEVERWLLENNVGQRMLDRLQQRPPSLYFDSAGHLERWLLDNDTGQRILLRIIPDKIRKAFAHLMVRVLAVQHPKRVELYCDAPVQMVNVCQLNIDPPLAEEIMEEQLPPRWRQLLQHPRWRGSVTPRATPKDGRQFGGKNVR